MDQSAHTYGAPQAHPDAAAPAEAFPGVLPVLRLPNAPFRHRLATDPRHETAMQVRGGGPATDTALVDRPTAPPAADPSPVPHHGIGRPDFLPQSSDRRAVPRDTPDRRRTPRTYASPWMARPQGGAVSPRPLRKPEDRQPDIRPLDTRIPQIPGIPEREAPAAAAAPAAPVAPAVEPPHQPRELAQQAPPAAVDIEQPAPPTQPPPPPSAAPGFAGNEWFPAAQAMTAAAPAPAHGGDVLGTIFDAGSGGTVHPAPSVLPESMPPAVKAAVRAPDIWFTPHDPPAAVSDGKGGVSALLYVAVPALLGAGAGLVFLQWDNLVRYIF